MTTRITPWWLRGWQGWWLNQKTSLRVEDPCGTSEVSYDVFRSAFAAGVGFVPGWFLKLVVLALIWAYLHHLIAGLRHLWMDATHAVTKQFGHTSAIATLALSVLLTLALGFKLFF